MKFRPQRGSLAKAMAEVVEVTTREELVEHCRKMAAAVDPLSRPPEEQFPAEALTIEPYVDSPDERIDWKRTCIVLVNGDALGFTDGDFEESPVSEPLTIR